MPGDERYSRQVLFRPLGAEGQQRLAAGGALIVGCGALGSHVAELLVRCGVGEVRLADRDFVEESNLHRQSLFREADAERGLPKAIAAADRLREINSQIRIEPFVEQVGADTIGRLAEGMAVIVDGTDNFDTRFLINDLALRDGLPWVYGACVGAYGLSATIVPGRSPCLRCLIDSLSAAAGNETCDTAGIIPPVPALIASIQAAEAIKILSGSLGAVSRDLIAVDLWDNSMQRFALDRDALGRDCPACRRGIYEYLEGEKGTRSIILCGRNAVQIQAKWAGGIDLEALATRLQSHGDVVRNSFLLRLSLQGVTLAVFSDGRAIVSGTSDPVRARTLYDRYVGS
jgi:adenylyltransferase/sulfurtransferase